MSRSTMFIVDADGDICDDSEYGNSWGFAVMVWQALVERYDAKIPAGNLFDRWPLLWKVADELPLLWWERNTLLATYDRAIIRGADLGVMADSFERFAEAHSKPGSACSLRAMATRLREHAALSPPPDVCFQATSVAEDPWMVYPEDEDGEGRTYNVNRDSLHFYIQPTVEPTPSAPRGTAT